MTRRKPMTAAEFLAEQEADPEYVARRQAQQERVRQQEAELKAAEAPLVDELRAAGVDVTWSWDLVNRATPYPEAVPILLRHLARPYPDPVREGIARALAVPDARFAWGRLCRLYREEDSGTRAKDGLAVALAAVADHDVLDDVIALLRDVDQGESRVFLVRVLGRSRDPRARAVLRELTDDPQVGHEASRMMA